MGKGFAGLIFETRGWPPSGDTDIGPYSPNGLLELSAEYEPE
jgi:hypothetical protein